MIVLGTGLTECVLSGLLSVEGKKVLHMDRNDYYGGECASLDLSRLFRKFKNGASPNEKLGRDRDYNIDLVPKFMMACEDLVNILVHTDVVRYLEFKQIGGSYVYREGKVAKVPATETEALTSPLMGLFEKRRARNFFEFMHLYDEANPKTHKGVNIDQTPMADVYKNFGLEPGTQDIVGHAMCLFLDDSYKNKPMRESHQAMVLYTNSLARYGKSPYIYPRYGLGELPQAFARLAAIHGGTYMLDKKFEEIVYENGVAVGVRADGEVARAKMVICDPSYAPDKVKKSGHVIRVICILNHPVPNTDNADSLQLIMPMNQLKRSHDIYIAVLSAAQNVCAPNHYIAIVSTIVETANPEQEVAPALQLLGPIEEKFVSISDIYEPVDDGKTSRVFVSKSYDATSHFQTVTRDIRNIYSRMMDKPLELKKRAPAEEDLEMA